jgi:hypothetical protein
MLRNVCVDRLKSLPKVDIPSSACPSHAEPEPVSRAVSSVG